MQDIDVKYKGLEAHIKKQTLTDEQFEELLEGQLRQAAVRRHIEDRPAQTGDEIIFDYVGFMGEEQFPGGTAERQSLVLGSNAFIPGFEEQCVGKSAGESFDVCVTFPADYAAPMLAGNDAVFHCKLHDIFKEDVPELTDEFAKKAGCADVNDYRVKLREQAQRSLDAQARFEARDALMHNMLEGVELEVTKEVINAELDVMMAELSDQLTLQGFGMEQYCQYTGKSKEFLRAEMLTDAIFRVRLNLVLEHIAEKEGITLSDEEFEDFIAMAGKEYGMSVENVKSAMDDIMLAGFRQDLLRQKTENFILDHANIIEE